MKLMKHMPKKPKLTGKTEKEFRIEMLNWFGKYAYSYGDIDPKVEKALRAKSLIYEPMTIKQIQNRISEILKIPVKYDHVKIGLFKMTYRGILDFGSSSVHQKIYSSRKVKDGSKYVFFHLGYFPFDFSNQLAKPPEMPKPKMKPPSLFNGMEKEITQVINQMDLQNEISRFNGGMKSALYKDGILITAHRVSPEKAISLLKGMK